MVGHVQKTPAQFSMWLGKVVRWFRQAVSVVADIKQMASRRHGATKFAWNTCRVAFGLTLVAIVIGSILIARLTFGPLTISGLGPQIAKALDERFGRGYEFSLGETAIVRNGYAPALSMDKLSLKERTGRTILTAPRAEVSIDPFALFVGRVTPRRLEIFDVELHLALLPDGSLAWPVSPNFKEAVPLTPPLADALAQNGSVLPPDTSGTLVSGAAGLKPRALLVKQMAGSIRLVIDTLTNPESPVAAIDRVGITRGRIIIDDQTTDQTMVFNGVNLGFDKTSGATTFKLSVEGPNGRWSVSGVAHGAPGAARELKLSFANLSLDEILLATGTRGLGADFDMPLSGGFNIGLRPDGMLSEAVGQFELGSGYLRFDDINDEPMMIDKIDGRFHWDASARRIVLDRSRLLANTTHFAVSGSVALPEREGDPWLIGLSTAEPNVSGAERPGQKPVVIDRGELGARLFLTDKKLVIDRLSFSGPECGFAMAGGVDWINGPHIRLGASIAPTPVKVIMRLWPSFISAPVRSYLMSRASEGIVESGTMQIDFDAVDLQAMRAELPAPDEKALVDFTIANASLEFLPGVPPLRGINGAGHITGRTAVFQVANAEIDAGHDHILNLTEGSFQVPDTALKPAPAVMAAKVTGSVEAIGELLSYDALKPFASLPLDSSTLSGQTEGNLEIDVKLGPDTGPADTVLKINAAVTNFTADKLIGTEKLEDATLNVSVDPSGLKASGQGRIFDAPAVIEMTKLTGKPAEASISLTLDDAMRTKHGFGAAGITGPIGAKLTAPIGGDEKPKARIELDLNKTAIDVAGVSKPAGRPGKIGLSLSVNDDGTLLDQINVESGTIQAHGSVELGAGLAFKAAKFPQVKFSPGDDIKIEATRAGETVKVVVQGTTIDARPFLKSLIFSPPPSSSATASTNVAASISAAGSTGDDRKDVGPVREIEYDVKAAILSGYNKKIISGTELIFVKRGDQIKQFTVSGTFGQAPISCNLTEGGASPQLNLVSEDAGSLLSFLDLYKHMEHGRLTVGMRLGPDVLAGLLVIDNFVLRDEPALRRLVMEGAPPLDTAGRAQKIDADAMAFNKLQVRFHRDGSRLDLSEGTMHGESIGLTVEGALDFVHDRVDMKGTFVPVYAFNNLFAKIPVFGLLLAGGTDEGLIGVNYRITGLASAPTLSINPLSAIAPGIFRQIFGVVDSNPMRPMR